MTSALDRRRAAKAVRRKSLVGAKRKAAGPALSLAEKVRRAAAGSFDRCMLHAGLFEQGNGTLILARTAADGELVMAAFLLDVFCLGVKDVMLQSIDPITFDLYLKAMDAASPLVDVEPSYARKLVRASVAYAQSIGFDPPREYALAERLFGDVPAEACPDEFTFGYDGKPLYIPGPSESAGQVGRRMQALHRRLGEGGFDFAIPHEAEDENIAANAEGPAHAAPQLETPTDRGAAR